MLGRGVLWIYLYFFLCLSEVEWRGERGREKEDERALTSAIRSSPPASTCLPQSSSRAPRPFTRRDGAHAAPSRTSHLSNFPRLSSLWLVLTRSAPSPSLATLTHRTPYINSTSVAKEANTRPSPSTVLSSVAPSSCALHLFSSSPPSPAPSLPSLPVALFC